MVRGLRTWQQGTKTALNTSAWAAMCQTSGSRTHSGLSLEAGVPEDETRTLRRIGRCWLSTPVHTMYKERLLIFKYKSFLIVRVQDLIWMWNTCHVNLGQNDLRNRTQREISSSTLMHLFCQAKIKFAKIPDKFRGGYKRWFYNPSSTLYGAVSYIFQSSPRSRTGLRSTEKWFIRSMNQAPLSEPSSPLSQTFCFHGS